MINKHWILTLEKKRHFLALAFLGLFLLGIFIYSDILNSPFVYDDYSSIINNTSIRSVTNSLKNISSNRYLPLLSFSLNYAVNGLNPFGYHLINNLIHIINALFVYYLVFLTLDTSFFERHKDIIFKSRYFLAFSSAFVFVAHPIQTQAVTYVVQRSTLIATMFYLLSIVMYIKFRLKDKRLDIDDKELKTHRLCFTNYRHRFQYKIKPIIYYLTSIICAILAMRTKEIAFTLPVTILLYEYFFLKNDKNKLKRFLYLLPILLTILIIPLSMLNITEQMDTIAGTIDVRSRETINISRIDYLLTQFRVCITYLRLLIFPINQNFDYDYPIYNSFFNPNVIISFFILLAIFCFGIFLLNLSRFPNLNLQPSTSHIRFSLFAPRFIHPGSRLIAFGIFWFFITLSVESSIIPIRDVIVEHRLYLPSIGFIIASISLVNYLLPFRKMKIVLIILIVMFLSIGTYTRNIIWRAPQTLWEDVISKAPNNSRAYNNLGVIYKEKEEFDKAIELFEKALKSNRNYTAVYYNLGDIQYRLGNYDNAIAYLNQALTGKLNHQLHLDILNKLGRTYSAMGHTPKAIEIFEKAVGLFPSSTVLLNNLGIQYIKNNQIDYAIEILEKAIMIEKKLYLYNNLALAYAMKGDEEKSMLLYKRALELKSKE